jgi:alkylation response protein AidB-like acyl-CoA dehydrogenase
VAPSSDPVAAARDIAPLARELAADSEAQRHLAAPVVEALRDAGLFRLCLPRPIGGLDVHPGVLVRCIEAVAAGDGAAGWCLMIGATSGSVAAWLDPEVAQKIFSPKGAIAAGVFAPRGTATSADGGIRLSGRWPWGSGCQHSTVLMGGVVVDGVHTMALLPASDVQILDTWRAAGLRGTGSHDLLVEDRFVPDARLAAVLGPPVIRTPLARFPFLGLLSLGIAAVALGIARTALDELVELANAKVPMSSSRTLARRTSVQGDVARGDALLQAGRILVEDSIADAWASASRGRPLTVDHRAQLRLAATMATRWSCDVVDIVQRAAGGTAVLEDAGPIPRCFRDIHAVTQHLAVAPSTLELVGRVRLGLDAEGVGL